ncbi:MAG: alpha/beta hydrolase [Burkholderiales bacterium]|nr:MAG: alpha/beta hydrolase [Burkholderiales bacterium]
MSSPRLEFVTCAHLGGLHRLAYWEWGDRDNPETVICAHGLTRNGRDFDALAAALAGRYRIVCPDMPGRGRSDWLSNANLYDFAQYVADCVTLVARLGVERLAWVGTSMGGLIGMSYAAMRGNPISRLLLNDIGPAIDPAGVSRIDTYVGKAPTLDSYEQAKAYTKEVSAGFGPHDEAGWDMLARHYWVEDHGRWRAHYDPRIAEPIAAAAGQPAPQLWFLYDAIHCPTWVVRGVASDLLSSEVARQMSERGPRAHVVEVPGVGHAPSFIPSDQIAIVEAFLTETQG